MVAKPLFTPESLRQLIDLGEGQFVEFKGAWSYASKRPRALGPKELRPKVAEYVAAFANADGGTLIIGVEDDGTVSGHGRSEREIEELLAVPQRRLSSPLSCDHQLLEIEGHEVLVIEVPRVPRAVMVNGNGFPYRTGDQVIAQSEEWINGLKREYLERGFEQRLADASRDDLDLALLPASGADPGWLARHGLVLPRHGSPALTNAAVLLAGREPTIRWHPAQTVRVFRVDGVEVRRGADRNVHQVERLELPITRLIPAAYAVVAGQIRRSEKLHDLFFREVPEYPTFAWQEGVVNAVAHRDYADRGRGVEVWLFDDRLEIRSPGVPVAPVTVQDLASASGIHASRNPAIARVLVELGLMREEGEGIPRMFDEMRRSLLHAPEFDVTGDERLLLTLRNTPIFQTADGEWRAIVEALELGDAQRRVLLAHPGGFTNEQYRELNGVDRDEAYRQIQEMVSSGVVTAADRPGRGAQYLVSAALLETRAWLTQRLPAVQDRLAELGAITNADYRELFGLTRSAARLELRRLVDEQVLELRGERRGAHYVAGARIGGQ
jgi:ATP-dependent DNA helicase RecG